MLSGMRQALMFMPATPHFTAFRANVPSRGFIARTIGSHAGFNAVPQPSQIAASGVAGAVMGMPRPNVRDVPKPLFSALEV